jgi:hypothetical protein
MSNVIPLKPFIVRVTFDAEVHYFVAECDDLVFVTEAPTFEELTERVWAIAPEMAQENGHHIAPHNLRLRFEFDQSLTDNRIAL